MGIAWKTSKWLLFKSPNKFLCIEKRLNRKKNKVINNLCVKKSHHISVIFIWPRRCAQPRTLCATLPMRKVKCFQLRLQLYSRTSWGEAKLCDQFKVKIYNKRASFLQVSSEWLEKIIGRINCLVRFGGL